MTHTQGGSSSADVICAVPAGSPGKTSVSTARVTRLCLLEGRWVSNPRDFSYLTLVHSFKCMLQKSTSQFYLRDQLQSHKSTHRQPCLIQPTHIHHSPERQEQWSSSYCQAPCKWCSSLPCQFYHVSSPSQGNCLSPEHHHLHRSIMIAS